MTNSETTNTNTIHRKKKGLSPAQVIVLGFLGFIFLGSFFLSLPISNANNEWLPFIDALFTAVSSVCVTGLIVVPTAVNFTIFGQIMVITLIQVGGLGFMTMASLLFMMIGKRITMKDRLIMQEALGKDDTKGVVKMMRYVIFLTLSIEFVGFLLLLPSFVTRFGAIGIYKAMFTAISAFCNAGFDLMGTPATPWLGLTPFVGDPLVTLTVSLLIVLGGIGFMVMTDVASAVTKKRHISLSSMIALITTGVLIVSSFFAFFIAEYNNPYTMANLNLGEKILASIFQAISPRTAGFNTIDLAGLTPFSKNFTTILMFIGASPASTGGGIKTTTLALLLIVLISGIRGKPEITIAKRTISTKVAYKAVSLFVSALIVVQIIALLLLATQGNSIPAELFTYENVLFETVSAFGTVGLSLGITPYLNIFGKLLLMFLMFLGRVGPITLGLVFLARKSDINIKYPEENILIG